MAKTNYKTKIRSVEKLRAFHHKQIQITFGMCTITDFKPLNSQKAQENLWLSTDSVSWTGRQYYS